MYWYLIPRLEFLVCSYGTKLLECEVFEDLPRDSIVNPKHDSVRCNFENEHTPFEIDKTGEGKMRMRKMYSAPDFLKKYNLKAAFAWRDWSFFESDAQIAVRNAAFHTCPCQYAEDIYGIY